MLEHSSDLSQWFALSGGTGVAPEINLLPALSRSVLPDGAGGSAPGKGFTCTGADFDGALWIGNLGYAQPGQGTGAAPSIVCISEGSMTERAISLAPQGVAAAGDRLFYATGAAAGPGVYQMTKTGEDETLLFALSGANGLAMDRRRDALWVSVGGSLFLYALDGTLLRSIVFDINIDHIHHDADRDWLWLTGGGNGQPGILSALDLADDTLLKRYRMEQATACEGLFIRDGKLNVMHDGYFHQSAIAASDQQFNEVQTYPLSYGVIAGTLPDLVRLDHGAGSTTADYAILQGATTGVADARVGAVHVAPVSAGSDIMLRVSDSTGNARQRFDLNEGMQRIAVWRDGAGDAASLQIMLRGSWTTTRAAAFWIQAGDVQPGPALSSHIPRSGAAAQRAEDRAAIDLAPVLNPAESSFLFDVAEADWNGGTEHVFGLGSDTATRIVAFRRGADGRLAVQISQGGAIIARTYDISGAFRLAVAGSGTSASIAVTGQTLTTGEGPEWAAIQANLLNLGGNHLGGGARAPLRLRSVAYHTSRLPDAWLRDWVNR
ncbi:hypothetical protein [Brevirhabdus sp.]|uniref:hypothetical protein n=1 Tax=Brevirhabdus sp. TaxID=2004514 RepID=UPI00405957CF